MPSSMASWALGEIRRTKSEAKKPLRTPVVDFHVTAPAADLAAFEAARADVAASGFVQQVRTSEGETRAATVELGEFEPTPRGRRVNAPLMPLDKALYRELVRRALAEDMGWGDATTEGTIEDGQRGHGRLLAKQDCVIAGLDVAEEAFLQLDPDVDDGASSRRRRACATRHARRRGHRAGAGRCSPPSGRR